MTKTAYPPLHLLHRCRTVKAPPLLFRKKSPNNRTIPLHPRHRFRLRPILRNNKDLDIAQPLQHLAHLISSIIPRPKVTPIPLNSYSKGLQLQRLLVEWVVFPVDHVLEHVAIAGYECKVADRREGIVSQGSQTTWNRMIRMDDQKLSCGPREAREVTVELPARQENVQTSRT